MTAIPRIALSCSLGAATLLAQDRVTQTDTLYPGCWDPAWFTSRVVDDITGAPVAGAEVFLVKESETPLAGEFWFTRKAMTDADGFLRIPIGDIEKEWHFAVLRHPDHGACTMWYRPEVWRVGRPFDVPVLVRDWAGRPAPGAKIGFCGSCGHGPDLAGAVADERGVAVLRGVDPHNHIRDVYVQHPGLGLGYDSVEWYPGDPPTTIECGHAPARKGRVVDHLGKPIAGAFVSAPDVHRGPWARTDEDGAFTLLGATDDVALVKTRDGRQVWFPPPSRYPVTLKMPDPEGDDPHEGTISVPVKAPGADSAAVRHVRVQVAKGVRVHTSFPGELRQEDRPPEGTIAVPEQGPFALSVSSSSSNERILRFGSIAELPAEPVALRPLPPTRLTARLIDGDGDPVGASVRVRGCWSTAPDVEEEATFERCEDGQLELAVEGRGLVLLELCPERTDLKPRFCWVTLPPQGEDVRVDLGHVAFSSTPLLCVVDAAGQPLPDALVAFARPGLQEVGETLACDLDENGGWVGPDLREGDAVVVRLDEVAVPFRTVLQGDGPWRIAARAGRLDLKVTLARELEKRERVTVLLGDVTFEARGEFALRGLPHGPLRLWVSAPGHRTAILDTVIGAEPRTVEVTLLAAR